MEREEEEAVAVAGGPTPAIRTKQRKERREEREMMTWPRTTNQPTLTD
jgi:hypothetical protein